MRLSRRYETTKEFRERQGAFDFAALAFDMIEILKTSKNKMWDMFKSFKKSLFRLPTPKAPHQLVLEWDSIAQIPMFQPGRA